MPVSVETEIFPKDTYGEDEVNRERDLRMTAGATSSTVIDAGDHYVLTTVWP